MKRTISEIIDLINEKMENAKNNKDGFKTTKDADMEHAKAYSQLAGEMLAYADVLSLLETSHLTEQEKELEISKKVIDIFKKNLTINISKNKNPWNNDYWVNMESFEATEEEKKVLEDWLNDN